jgi:hypothetical protein
MRDVRGGVRDGSCLGLPATRNVVNSDSILQDLGANDVHGSRRLDGLTAVEVLLTVKKRFINAGRVRVLDHTASSG